MSVVSLSRTIYTDRTLSHPQSGGGARYWRSCHKRGLIAEWSSQWVIVRKISLMSKISQKPHQLCHWVVHTVQRPQTNGQHPVELLWNFQHSLTGQLRGPSLRSSSMTGWILHSLKLETVDQPWRTDLSETHQCTQDFLTEKLWADGVKYFMDTLRPLFTRGVPSVFPPAMCLFLSCKERKHGDCQVDWQNFFAPQAFERCLDWHATIEQHEWNPKTKSVSFWCGPRKWWKTNKKSGTSESGFTRNERKVECHTGGRRRKAISIQWLLDNIDVYCCKWYQRSPERERLTSSLSLQGVDVTAYSSEAVRTVFVALFCSPKSSMENPSLPVNKYGNHTSSTFIVEYYVEDKVGQWATDEITGEQGYVDYEGSCFWTWDNNESVWQSRPFKGRQVERRKGKGKGKGGFPGTRRAFLCEEQAQESELCSEEDSAWQSRGKRGKKGFSKGNESFRKGGFRTSPSDKGSISDFLSTQRQGQGSKRKRHGRCLSHRQDFQPLKILNRDRAIPGDQTIGIPVKQTISQLQRLHGTI